MEKAKFLYQLQKELKNDFTKSEQKEIIRDYTEYFDTGLSEGRSEQELCVEFGEPAFIVSELLNEKELKNKRREANIPVKRCSKNEIIQKVVFGLLLFMCLLIASQYRIGYKSYMNIYIDFVITLLFPISILGMINIQKIYQNTKIVQISKNAYLLALIPIAAAILYIAFFILPWILGTPLSFDSIGPLISIGIYFIYGILISLTYLIVLMSISKRNFKVLFIFFFTGLFITFLNIETMLGNLSDLSNFQHELSRCFYPLPFGSFLTIIAFWFAKKILHLLKTGE